VEIFQHLRLVLNLFLLIEIALTFVLNKVFSKLLEISVKLEEFDHLVEVVEGNDGVFGVSGDVNDLISIVFDSRFLHGVELSSVITLQVSSKSGGSR
jgi:hypothetical protein